jgi:monovalent cation:H+ antiporter-2, CPA2 family
MIASQALLLMNVPQSRVLRRMQEQRAKRYRVLRALLPGGSLSDTEEDDLVEQLRPIVLPPGSPAIGRTLAEVNLDGAVARRRALSLPASL